MTTSAIKAMAPAFDMRHIAHRPMSPPIRSAPHCSRRLRTISISGSNLTPSAQLTVAGPSLLIWNKRRHSGIGCIVHLGFRRNRSDVA
jgi:hypothetical protein